MTVTGTDGSSTRALFRSRLGSATLVNVLLGGPGLVLGIPIDVLSGAGYELVPGGARIPVPPAGATATVGGAAGPPEPLPLAPRPPDRLSLSLDLGGGVTTMNGEQSILHAGVVGTHCVTGPLLVGAAADYGAVFDIFGGGGGSVASLWAAAGVGGRPTRNARAVALLELGAHRYRDTRADLVLPAVGARVDWTAVFSDDFALGFYTNLSYDLGRRTLQTGPWDAGRYGGTTFVLGLSLGLLGR